ncbi:FERM domain-containing protein 5 isoform X2 [Hyposmocoma kahamanoa]|uniref:FERM domain-containing protein 5 isoform X2 n=1 Tax=Hyposmocoma kahamanoa TaxID=1477025 RepID=UPI000E6DA4CA|nr:FERM domain-containing protein 5 isoform X2 [Hyposmocoma kahamanoa]
MFKSRGDIVYKCTVRLLEDTEILECEFHPSYKGKYLLDHVCSQLNLTETDYFGLRYVDAGGQRHWLHMAKLILKQVKDASPILFSFRVKFYPPNPLLLKEDVTRFQVYLQLKRDLLHGRLYCTANEAAMLGALIIQIELGDYDPNIHVGNYVSEMRLLLRQTDSIEARIQEIHREPVEGTPGGSGGVKGMSTQEAERQFLKIACQLDTYGIDPHPVKDHRGNQLYLGINHGGIMTFQGGRKTHHFKWSEVHKINFEGRMFIVHLNYPEKKHTVGFKCPSGASCRHVWCCAIEQMLFFTLASSSDACVYSGGGLFSWGTKFKYVGRTEREILERDGLLAPRDHQDEGSSTSGGKRKASSVPATPSTPMTGDFGYSSLPRSTHSAPLEESASVSASEACNGGCLLAGPAVDIALAASASALGDDKPGQCACHIAETRIALASDYNPRDSFEHSSTESAATSHTHITHTGPPTAAGGGSSNEEWRAPPAPVPPALQPPPRPFSLLRAFVPSFVFVWISLAVLTLLVFETDWAPLRPLKRKPELVSLRHHYYAPLKEYLRKKVIELF